MTKNFSGFFFSCLKIVNLYWYLSGFFFKFYIVMEWVCKFASTQHFASKVFFCTLILQTGNSSCLFYAIFSYKNIDCHQIFFNLASSFSQCLVCVFLLYHNNSFIFDVWRIKITVLKQYSVNIHFEHILVNTLLTKRLTRNI